MNASLYSVNATAILRHFNGLTVWQRRHERAPHKPLLALWAIGRCLRGCARLVDYKTVHTELGALLKKFGPSRQNYKPQEPFWRMQKDGIWQVPSAEQVRVQSNGSVAPTELRKLGIVGGLTTPIHELFRRDSAKALEVAHLLLDAHFPETLHRAILEETIGDCLFDTNRVADSKVELDKSELLKSTYVRRRRNPKFRRKILETYAFRCAVCEFSLEFPNGTWPALEAAHIMWHSCLGPDDTNNGISLCVVHHELFDWGAFTILPDSLRVVVSRALLRRKSRDSIRQFHGSPLSVSAKHTDDRPADAFLNWHARNVFKDNRLPEMKAG
ncbi:phosphorothioated DNA-binding restriction endonuclease [Candidatus Rariloculus sp.]|uniref:phosphorothioated DNA-binding restriction endonuclease n=1 Tax=Candidatus Rariloculus sp. TaxID=3101265 RepID=UPI003D1497B2